MPKIKPIRQSVTVEAPPADAFAAFVDGFGRWWPRGFSWSGEGLERIGIDGRPGGFAYEIGPHGLRLDWGRVDRWDPPHRIGLTWQIGVDRVPEPNPARASRVDVRFTAVEGERTRVDLVHDGFDRHGGNGAAYRDALAADGWPTAMDAYARTVDRRHEAPWEPLTT